MEQKTRNIIEEINSYISKDDTNIETRGINLIESSINLLTVISEKFDPEVADELTRRFINSIKNRDSAKFQKKIRSVNVIKPVDGIKSLKKLHSVDTIPVLENDDE